MYFPIVVFVKIRDLLLLRDQLYYKDLQVWNKWKSMPTFVSLRCLAKLIIFLIEELSNLELSCGLFVADIVFFIALYQRWIYPIDPKRVNEFGTTGETTDSAAGTAEQEPKETKAIQNGVATPDAEVVSDKKND